MSGIKAVAHWAPHVVAGGETAGIHFAAWLAERLMLPMQYVRKKPKGFGRNAQIEGRIVEGGRTLLVEDLATDARSKVNFCEALRAAGQRCDHAFVFFFYDIFPQARTLMADLGVNLHYLVIGWDVLSAAKDGAHFSNETLAEVERFLHAPAGWSAAHGGISEFKPAGNSAPVCDSVASTVRLSQILQRTGAGLRPAPVLTQSFTEMD